MSAGPLKDALRNSALLAPWRELRQGFAVREWRARGCKGVPPHRIKAEAVRRYAERYGARILVETGTYLGDMVAACRPFFDSVITIELAPELARRARERFRADDKVRVLEGDSGALIVDVVRHLEAPALFWLDGHFSGGATGKGDLQTPILAELDAILGSSLRHIALVDDARLFSGTDDYPTIDGLTAFVQARAPQHRIAVMHDIIRIVPPAGALRDARSTA